MSKVLTIMGKVWNRKCGVIIFAWLVYSSFVCYEIMTPDKPWYQVW